MKKRLFLVNFTSSAKSILIKINLVTVFRFFATILRIKYAFQPKVWYRYSPGQPKGPNHETIYIYIY